MYVYIYIYIYICMYITTAMTAWNPPLTLYRLLRHYSTCSIA